MAGHSKWANIRARKGAQDAKRGKLFTKLIREISVAAREGGGDPNNNPRLRTAIDKALAANMKRDSIDNTVKKATGALEGVQYEEIRYEGYGAGGVAVMVDCLTDNKNRTVAEVRHAFTKCGGNLGTDGSVAYLFRKAGIINFDAPIDENRVMEAALEAGAEDILTDSEGAIEVLTEPEDFEAVLASFKQAGLKPVDAEITMKPLSQTQIEQKEAEKMLRLLEMLEDLDDVQNVYSNADISEEILEQIG